MPNRFLVIALFFCQAIIIVCAFWFGLDLINLGMAVLFIAITIQVCIDLRKKAVRSKDAFCQKAEGEELGSGLFDE